VQVDLETYRRWTLAGSVAGAVLFGAGLVALVEVANVPAALALMVVGIAAALSSAAVQIRGAPPLVPPSLLLLTRRECALCDEARALLGELRAEVPFDLWEVDVDADPELRARYGDLVPVGIAHGEEVFHAHLDEARVRAALARPGA
jgi:hypothetical protein